MENELKISNNSSVLSTAANQDNSTLSSISKESNIVSTSVNCFIPAMTLVNPMLNTQLANLKNRANNNSDTQSAKLKNSANNKSNIHLTSLKDTGNNADIIRQENTLKSSRANNNNNSCYSSDTMISREQVSSNTAGSRGGAFLEKEVIDSKEAHLTNYCITAPPKVSVGAEILTGIKAEILTSMKNSEQSATSTRCRQNSQSGQFAPDNCNEGDMDNSCNGVCDSEYITSASNHETENINNCNGIYDLKQGTRDCVVGRDTDTGHVSFMDILTDRSSKFLKPILAETESITVPKDSHSSDSVNKKKDEVVLSRPPRRCLVFTDAANDNNEDVGNVQRRKRGRPRKSPLPDRNNGAKSTPRKRGRPRKLSPATNRTNTEQKTSLLDCGKPLQKRLVDDCRNRKGMSLKRERHARRSQSSGSSGCEEEWMPQQRGKARESLLAGIIKRERGSPRRCGRPRKLRAADTNSEESDSSTVAFDYGHYVSGLPAHAFSNECKIKLSETLAETSSVKDHVPLLSWASSSGNRKRSRLKLTNNKIDRSEEHKFDTSSLNNFKNTRILSDEEISEPDVYDDDQPLPSTSALADSANPKENLSGETEMEFNNKRQSADIISISSGKPTAHVINHSMTLSECCNSTNSNPELRDDNLKYSLNKENNTATYSNKNFLSKCNGIKDDSALNTNNTRNKSKDSSESLLLQSEVEQSVLRWYQMKMQSEDMFSSADETLTYAMLLQKARESHNLICGGSNDSFDVCWWQTRISQLIDLVSRPPSQ